MVPQSLLGFFQSSVEAGGALIGLLFVAVTIAPAQSLMHAPLGARRLTAANTFTALVNAFFVSLVAQLPTVNLGIISVVMGALALVATTLLGYQWVKAPRDWLGTRWRALVILLSLAVYGWQLIEGVRLLLAPADTSTPGVLAVVVVARYAMGLWRAWDLLGGLSYYARTRSSSAREEAKQQASTAMLVPQRTGQVQPLGTNGETHDGRTIVSHEQARPVR